MDETLKKIKQVILETARKYGIEVDKIILFGSRARGDYREDSDWDILIVVGNKVDKGVLDKYWLEVGRELVKYDIVPEIIITSREELEKYGKYYGFVHYHALKEGIII